ncbi:MAG: hypothetical protein M1834_006443 [Cirrosporium novae-zelandiae]|nr:MAG: hypothetical protein M1834_006443 [Cirrosporium novae-zelandiae]
MSKESEEAMISLPYQLHPLSPITSSEIISAGELLRAQWPPQTDLHFKTITLQEPAKKELMPYLEAEHDGRKLPSIDRKAFSNYYIRNTLENGDVPNKFHEAIINLTTGTVERNARLGPFMHSPGDGDEIIAIEKAALEDAAVQAEVAKLQLPKGTVLVADPWIFGTDGKTDEDRLYQVFVYMRDPMNPSEVDSCHYALPLAISPIVDPKSMKVVKIELCPTGADTTIKETQPYKIKPPNEYVPEYQKLRTDLKPLRVTQPEGASFKITKGGEVVEWQKWHVRVGFNQREGIVLYDVRYDGRPLFYRLSLSDMNIPYADPRPPFYKKSAFDLGDAGAGVMANNLKLGCDCLGVIHYLDGVLSTDKGTAISMPNVICLHEQDSGIGWKHTNYRTGRAIVARNRELVFQSIITVSNYEYILAFILNQAGELDYEVRATGILSTQPIDDEVVEAGGVNFGTVVHPGVLACHHQHFFSLRVDPMLDGPLNTLTQTEAFAMPPGPNNPLENGYYTTATPITTACALDLNPATNRTFAITNPHVRNPINHLPVAYKIQVPPMQPLLSSPQSYNYARAEFASHSLFVTSYRDDELYAGGRYTNQSRGGTGVRSFASRTDKVDDSDIVVWVNFGINHIPRIEDFPVMPVEILRVAMKPVNFFNRNPALDVPPSSQDFNRSTLLGDMHQQPMVEAKIGEDCCASKL